MASSSPDPDQIDEQISIEFTRGEVELILEALDSHEYWGCGVPYDLPLDNGVVYVPGDGRDFWTQVTPGPEQEVGIGQVRVCRPLVSRLTESLEQIDERGRKTPG